VAIFVSCKCGRQSRTGDENAGRRATCPGCGRELVIPRAIVSATATAEEGRSAPEVAGAPYSGKAIASLLLGLFSFVCLFVTGVPAIFLGVMGIREIKLSRGRVRGRGLAVAGILLGAFGSTAIAVVLIVPAVRSIQEDYRSDHCTTNLRQIGLALHGYVSAEGRLPPPAILGKDGTPLLSWRVAILPYLGAEGQALHAKFHFDEPSDSPHNSTLLNERLAVFECPSAARQGQADTGYMVLVGPRTAFPGTKRPVALPDIPDGTSNTILVVESRASVPWTAPQDLPLDMTLTLSGASSGHRDGFNVLMADGSVRFFPYSIAPTDFSGLATRDGGETVYPP
jgi:prepilin-type processing-associated H-X9-DG protein